MNQQQINFSSEQKIWVPSYLLNKYIVSNGEYRAYRYLPTGSTGRQSVAVVDHPVVVGVEPHTGYSRRVHVYRPKQHNKFTPGGQVYFEILEGKKLNK